MLQWKVKAKEKAAAREAAESEPTMDLGAAVAQVEEEGGNVHTSCLIAWLF